MFFKYQLCVLIRVGLFIENCFNIIEIIDRHNSTKASQYDQDMPQSLTLCYLKLIHPKQFKRNVHVESLAHRIGDNRKRS